MREGWTYKKLEEVCEIICGQDYKNVESPDGKYPIYGTGGIMGYANQFKCPAYSIIVGRKGSINNPLYVEENFWNVDTAFGIVPSKDSLSSKFFYYYCKKYDFTKHNVAVTIPSLRRIDLLKIPVPVPPLSEQQRIVSELDLLSSIIDKKKAQLKEYDQLAQSIFYDMFGDPVENPKGWEVKRYRDFAEIIGGYAFNSKSFVDSGVPVLKIGNINTGVLRLEEICYYPYTPSLKRYEVHSGDLVISLTGTTGKDDYGNICIIPSYADTFYLNQRNAILRPNETCNNIFLQYVFKQRTIKKELTKNNHGVRQANILNQDILSLSIPLPPLPLQQSFASKIQAIERQKALIQQSIAEVQMLFDSRMDDWFA